MSKEKALNTARKLVEEAVEVAHKAGIDPASVIEPFCPKEDVVEGEGGPGGNDLQEKHWGGTPVVIDAATTDLFAMPAPDTDPDQDPEFRVTPSTATLVEQDFERYKPSLERMVENWQEEKNDLMRKQKAADQDPT